jgi:hypothetical protein
MHQQSAAERIVELLDNYLNARDLYYESFDRGVHEGYKTFLKIQMEDARHRLRDSLNGLVEKKMLGT